jgi:hypothetical protein
MREDSTNKLFLSQTVGASHSEAKSLFRKILALSHCRSRFCRYSANLNPGKSIETKILSAGYQKKIEMRSLDPLENAGLRDDAIPE